jgi:hypothetical protein
MLEHLWEYQAELSQDRRISTARGDAQRAGEQVRSMERQVEALVLLNQALAELLCERLGVREDEVLAKVTEIDLRDGNRDGKVAGAVQCAQCSRPFSRRLQRCLYCGHVSPDAMLLDRLRPAPAFEDTGAG